MTGFVTAGGPSSGRAGLGVLNALGAGISARVWLSLTRSTVAGALCVWGAETAALGGRRAVAGFNVAASYASRASAKVPSRGCSYRAGRRRGAGWEVSGRWGRELCRSLTGRHGTRARVGVRGHDHPCVVVPFRVVLAVLYLGDQGVELLEPGS